MKTIFDVLLCMDCLLMIFVFIGALVNFPRWVQKIDMRGNKKNQPLEHYSEKIFFRMEIRLIIIVLIAFFIALFFFFFGSTPKKIEEPGFGLFIPVLILLIGTGMGAVFLGEYFTRIAKNNNLFQKTNRLRSVYVRSRAQFGIGAVISFYFFLVIFFALTDLFFIAGWI